MFNRKYIFIHGGFSSHVSFREGNWDNPPSIPANQWNPGFKYLLRITRLRQVGIVRLETKNGGRN